MSFPRYPAYKDSGVEWLGPIPTSWSVCALKRIVSLQSGEAITSEQIEVDGTYPVYGGNGLRGYCEAFTHDGEFALIGRQGALCGNINYARDKFWASEHAVVVTPKQAVATKWIGELLRAMNLNQYSVAAAQPGLSVEIVGNLGIPVPSRDEQAAIATFLDRETAKIDALVAEQEQLITLLKEKRQAVISHAVTKGLDPSVPMKDSGVEWLGEVPAHWHVSRLKNMSPEITVGVVVEPSKYYCEDGVPALRSLNVTPMTVQQHGYVYFSTESNDLLAKSKLRAGDLVAVRSGQPGTTAVVPLELDGCNCIDLIIIRKPLMDDERFMAWYLNSDAAIRQFTEGSGGAIQQHFNVGTAMNLLLTRPPVEEQQSIVAEIERRAQEVDRLLSEAVLSIELLRERRSALISAAVTGQIDVRGLAPAQEQTA